jgi:hypothetical protein
MTTTQQTKIAELLVNKLKQAHKQSYEEILPPSVKANQIRQQMVMAGVVYELVRDAYIKGSKRGFISGSNAAMNIPNKTDAIQDFDNYLNNLTCTTHEMK